MIGRMIENELPPAAQELAAQARRIETPCCDGVIAWGVWGVGAPGVLLQGGSGRWTHGLRNTPALGAAGRMAVVPDLPGFGESARPPDGGDADAVVAPLADGLQALFGDKPLDGVAFSFGSLVAVLMGAQQPQRFSRLVLVGAPVVPLQQGRGVALKPWSRSSTAEQRAQVHRQNLAAIMLHRPTSIDDLAVRLQAVNVPRDRMRHRRLVTTTAFADAFVQLRCPVAAIYGGQDVLMRGIWPQVEQTLRRHPLFAGLTVVPQAGHWVQYEDAEPFNAAMLAALRG